MERALKRFGLLLGGVRFAHELNWRDMPFVLRLWRVAKRTTRYSGQGAPCYAG